ncbi:GmrSD restriction endonuclease domain-containing protein [Ellagibacter isourolithinifaciens]|uniref:GmrSD restriction endonuclease domain-containing protein n=1 Tax=Ellagibacter isourolithinifaciens TaxID=2137581 RepID=UPI003AAF1363
MKINDVLSQIDLGNYALPEFQRGYVWTRSDVRKLMYSLYRDYPVGSLLIWDTATDPDIIRGDGTPSSGTVSLILDGQQRMTSLFGVIRGKAPQFFDGDASAFTNLYFNIDEETFEFYSQQKMKGDRAWVSVSEVIPDSGAFFTKVIAQRPDDMQYYAEAMTKLNKLSSIKDRDMPVQVVAGEDKTIDVVVEIFNNVNSGGTKLSKGDLALAKICAQWPDMRAEMKAILARLGKKGFWFKQDWLLRCLTVHLTRKAYFSELDGVSVADVKNGLKEVENYIGTCLDHISSRLGLDHDRVLGSHYAIVLMVGYLSMKGGKLSSAAEWDKLLFWYVHAFLWGRYAGSTESVLSQDLRVLEDGKGVDGLIELIHQNRADLTLRPQDFWGWSKGARFYPLLYMITRVNHARDWGTGIELSQSLLGKNSSLQVHHIFPKHVLYSAGKTKSMVNALANYAFLTQQTNLDISDQKPEDYFPIYMEKCPGAIESHCVPTASHLLTIDAYDAFLEERRKLLAKSANAILEDLWKGKLAQPSAPMTKMSVTEPEDDEEAVIEELVSWLKNEGFAPGIKDYSAVIGYAGTPIIIDVAWPDGLQEGFTEPVALMINEEPGDIYRVNAVGYRVFTRADDLKNYVCTKYGAGPE